MIKENDEILKDAMADGLRELRLCFGGLDDTQRKELNEIIDRTEREGNYYTVLFVLMGLEDNIREARERLERCVYYKNHRTQKKESDD